jgi:hypothetical protein
MTAEEFIPKEIRRLLAESPIQELRPHRLVKWAEEFVTKSRRNGMSDMKIASWIKDYGRAQLLVKRTDCCSS